MVPNLLLPKFDTYLASLGLKFQGTVIGAAALNLSGIITRETVDCDILDPQIPETILNAATSFAKTESIPESKLKEVWFNNGPSSLVRYLPSGWRDRLVEVYKGKALTLHTLGRSDLLKTKLLALSDRGRDLNDCIQMKPSLKELHDSYAWVAGYDGNAGWPKHVELSFQKLAGKLGYEFHA